VFEIFKTHIEPYVTVLNNFDLRFKKMAISPQIQQIDPRLLADLQELRDTREEVLRELGREEGRELGREEGRELGRELGREEGLRDSIKTLAKKRFPKIKNASFQTLSELSANELQEILVEMLDISDMHSLQKLLADKKSLAPKK
jgi:flagellar biosynthesis/type III secretory pathway protein FliH